MNYCPLCGTRAVGAFCGACGTSTSNEAPIRSVVASSAAMRHSESGGVTEPLDVVLPRGDARRTLVWETRFVMLAFLLPVVISAVLLFARHLSGVGDISRFPSIVQNHPVTNLVLGILAYLPVFAMVPLALFLLSRTGQGPSVLGLGAPSFKSDVVPGLGIGAAALGIELLLLLPFVAFINQHSSLFSSVTVSNEPKYYLIEAIVMSAVTAITEEVLVNGYLITRLGQLGWSPRTSLVLSLVLRTSYHVYYGLGFLLTIPFGYLVTRSFQKHHKLNRPVVAHFLFDAILMTIAILK